MRFLMIAGAATILLSPLSAPANACGAKHSAQAASTEYSAQTKKPDYKSPMQMKVISPAASPSQ